MKVAVIFANGTEEIEALTPVDILRRAKIEVDIVSINGKEPIGSHNIKIIADKVIEETNINDYDGIVIPGGMPGATNISNNKKVVESVKEYIKTNKLVASICASPAVVLANKNIIKGRKATCYPAESFIKMMKENIYTASDIEVDGNLITANGPKSALNFALSIVKYFDKEINF